LSAINGITFTEREVDIISCLLYLSSYKRIGSFLSVSHKTVETHLRNVMVKIGCNSREDVIKFIHKFDSRLIIKSHYLKLWCQSVFENELKKIAELGLNIKCIYIYYNDNFATDPFTSETKSYLKLAGVGLFSIPWGENQLTTILDQVLGDQSIDCVIYDLTMPFIGMLKEKKYDLQDEVTKVNEVLKSNANAAIIINRTNLKFPLFTQPSKPCLSLFISCPSMHLANWI